MQIGLSIIWSVIGGADRSTRSNIVSSQARLWHGETNGIYNNKNRQNQKIVYYIKHFVSNTTIRRADRQAGSKADKQTNKRTNEIHHLPWYVCLKRLVFNFTFDISPSEKIVSLSIANDTYSHQAQVRPTIFSVFNYLQSRYSWLQ